MSDSDTQGSHRRSSSLSVFRHADTVEHGTVKPRLTPTSRALGTWTYRRPRPSVVGHFSDPYVPQAVGPQDTSLPPSRPSMSSTTTYSTSTTSVTSSSTFSSSRKYSFGSIGQSSGSMFRSSGPSLWSLPTNATHMFDPPNSTKTLADETPVKTVRVPLSLKTLTNNMADDTERKELTFCLPRVGTSKSKSKYKRKLVISGIKKDDLKRIEGVKQWCESFGELSQFIRMPNGDLEVHFRDNEVADTVCRLHARVCINGVGSVGLSWYTSKRT
ncbi:hypothetical protein PUNSTDRAFT_140406 [Punctularia strigosozonata HHB-11173 SS5]|uniref:uncharacterized protein n=1 Tax=Punctularia strigosozonata (strain HHB-11173) TaxID=741275 RepID=UPI000441738D|nr:uncharacterized protein PUNSTDRAFT_140406 [Punctularia strigosozonata HHB-11173 SS5]EIN14007.1 hypothetical protein PUNSTDRAFT_140406 [Punctularia strigosozonata HHB-11173 SS5]